MNLKMIGTIISYVYYRLSRGDAELCFAIAVPYQMEEFLASTQHGRDLRIPQKIQRPQTRR